MVSAILSYNNIILEWTTSLESSSGTLICPSICPRQVGRNNYVPLFGVDQIEWRLTRYYVIRDVIVIFECWRTCYYVIRDVTAI